MKIVVNKQNGSKKEYELSNLVKPQLLGVVFNFRSGNREIFIHTQSVESIEVVNEG